MKRIDLHIHTTYSDGQLTPIEILAEARNKNFDTISITDHDCINGYLLADEYATEYGIELVPGVEVSSYCQDKEVHILGYYFDPTFRDLKKMLTFHMEKRIHRAEVILHKLKELFGFSISFQELQNVARNNFIGRAHIAAVMLQKGYTNSFNDAFTYYISNRSPANEPKKTYSSSEVIKIIHDSGGVAILAHPGVINNDSIVEELIDSGIDGLEIFYPTHSNKKIKTYLSLAKEHSQLVTGGSDFHRHETFRNQIGSILLDEKYFKRLKNKIG